MACIVLLTMGFIHPLAELLVVFAAPPLVAAAFAGGIRARYRWFARVAAVVCAITGSFWLIVMAGSEENLPAVLIGALVVALLMFGIATAGAFLLDRAVVYRSAWRS